MSSQQNIQQSSQALPLVRQKKAYEIRLMRGFCNNAALIGIANLFGHSFLLKCSPENIEVSVPTRVMVVNTSLLPDHNSMSDRSKMIAIDDSIVFGEVSRFLCNDCGLDFKKRFGSFKFNWMEPFNNTEFLMFGEEVIKVVKSLDVMDYARRKQIVVKLEPQNPQIRQLFQRTHHLSSWLNTHEEVILKSNMKILQFMKIHTFDNKCENEIFQNFENAERVESLKRKDRTKRKLLGWYTKPKQPQFDM